MTRDLSMAIAVLEDPALWRAILASDHPAAVAFREWVATDLDPALEAGGNYDGMSQDDLDEMVTAAAMCFGSPPQ
jgi:prophage antirepressor-like protein